jgi:hypothetical protein
VWIITVLFPIFGIHYWSLNGWTPKKEQAMVFRRLERAEHEIEMRDLRKTRDPVIVKL